MVDATRAEQLRAAKQRQRARDKAEGLGFYQVKLPLELIEKLKAGMSRETFPVRLANFIDVELIEPGKYKALGLLCWNRNQNFVTRDEAFQIYERNWRHVDESDLDLKELALISSLKTEFGRGVINA
jgi:hypothetical protein